MCYNIASVVYVLFFWPQGMWDLRSPTREQTCISCIGRRSPTTRPLNSYIGNANPTLSEWLPRTKLGDHRDEIGFVSALKCGTSKVP